MYVHYVRSLFLLRRFNRTCGRRNKVATFSVKEFSSITIYAFVRPQTPKLTVYLINPDLHDNVGIDPVAGALDSFDLNTGG